jgi:protein-arginine kinase activator protein McsA
MICENCKKKNASLVFLPEKEITKKGRFVIWHKYLCAGCYISLAGFRGEYEKMKKEQ